MSQTVPPQPYNQWLADTLQEIGLRFPDKNNAPPVLQPGGTQPRPLMVPPQGKGRSLLPGASLVRGMVFGDADSRHAVDPQTRQKLDSLYSDGLATPVQVASHGRTLSGNFYSAEGHNLKQQQGQPDLSRPLVLLLTGSGGSAEDQGFETSQFYAKNGASVLSVNYGGYGGSTGETPTEDSILKDAHAMLQHAVDLGYDPENIIIHGYSLGGGIAGNLKETAESGGHKFRGLVLDRPMLSVAHGIESHVPKGLRTVAGQFGRKAMGKLSARSVIEASNNTDTRTVVTSDQNYFADRADEFRTRLANDGKGRVVTGGRTGGDHFDHAAMLNSNAANLTQLIAQDRGGAVQQVSSGNASAHKMWDTLMQDVQGALNVLRLDTADLVNKVAQLQGAATPTALQIRTGIAKAEQTVRSGFDIIRFAPFQPWKDQAQREVDTLEQCLTTLSALLVASGDTGDSPPMLVEVKVERAKAAVAALAKAGGPPNQALENPVLTLEQEARQLRGPGAQRVLAELASTILQIEQARAQRRARVAGLAVRRRPAPPRRPAPNAPVQANAT